MFPLIVIHCERKVARNTNIYVHTGFAIKTAILTRHFNKVGFEYVAINT